VTKENKKSVLLWIVGIQAAVTWLALILRDGWLAAVPLVVCVTAPYWLFPIISWWSEREERQFIRDMRKRQSKYKTADHGKA
jgi:hypothetical protein